MTFGSALLGLVTLLGIYFYLKPDLPSVDVLKDVRLQTPMKIYSQDGKLISQFGVKKRIPLKIRDIPIELQQAVIATEDSRFYEHPGIDPIGIARAALNLILTGEKQQGASTLSMQLARGFFLSRDKTYIRKIKEIFIAWHMERLLTKEEILELYLNKNELGHRSFGVGAAAQVYYGKEIGELTLAQIATIAGMNKAPSTLNPISNPKRAKERRRVVLLRMLDENYITREQFDQAANEPVTGSKHGAEIELHAPYLADLIYQEMIDRYGKETAETEGFQVYATVPSHLQIAAQKSITQNLHDYDERHGYRGALEQLWRGPEPNFLKETEDLINELSGQEQNPLDTEAPLESEYDTPWTEEQMLAYLDAHQDYFPIQGAIVTQVREKEIQLFTADHGYQTIYWDGMDWARPYINDSKQGPIPNNAADIVSVGQHVWVRQRMDDDLWHLSQLPDVSGAFVAMDPKNGAVRAIVGGYSFEQSQFNRATQAERQLGSNIKPFLYSAALDSDYTIASIINDAPINQWDRNSGNAWRPENSPAEYDGPIRMRIALGKSKNVVAIRLLRGIGIDGFINHLSRFGFDRSEVQRDESISIGSPSFTPLEVATGYAAIANGGYGVQPHFIERIESDAGNLVWQANPAIACDNCLTASNQLSNAPLDHLDDDLPSPELIDTPPIAEQVISPQNAFLVSEMMRTAMRGNGSTSKKTYWLGTGWRARNILQRSDIYGKTGTTNDSKDTWFSGFAGGLVATTWVGFDDVSRALGRVTRNQNIVNRNPRYTWIGNGITSEGGAQTAQPGWIRFMQQALKDQPEVSRPIPTDVVKVRIDRSTGKLTHRTDHTSLFEFFIKGTEPTEYVREDEIIDLSEDADAEASEEEEIF
jgi:penicillin-binding protein 1A